MIIRPSRMCLCSLLFTVMIPAIKAVAVQHDMPPDLIFHNAKVVTVDKVFSIQQAVAVAVAGESIVAVGSDEQIYV